MSKLPVSRVVTSTVNLSPAGAQSQSLSDILILGNSDVIDPTERMRTYAALADVATDFGTNVPEYYAARRWFGQSPQPTQVRIGRWAQTAAKGGLRCAPLTTAEQALGLWTAIVAGKFAVAIDGAAAIQVGPMDFSGAANLNAVAAIIDAATAGASCKWNATYGRFEFESDTTGATSAVGFLAAPAAGVDISHNLKGRVADGGYVFAGVGAESIEAALAIFDDRFGQQWYGVTAPTGVDADQEDAAAYVQGSGNKHILFATTVDPLTLVAANDTCLAALLRDAGYLRACVQYSSLDAYAVDSYAARILTTDYAQPASVITMKFKQEPGVTSENLSTTQANAVEAKNANVFVAYDNNTVIVENGVQSSGEYTDVVAGTDWLALECQTALYNVLYTTPTKIPQTDAGVGILIAAVDAVLDQAVRNGLLAPGVWNSDGFGQLKPGDFLQKGYYVYATPISQQSQADRAARKAPALKIAAKLAGAIHTADIQINVNR